MSNTSIPNFMQQQFSLCPTNGRQAVGDGAFTCDNTPNVLAVCHIQGTDDMYYYSTTFSGGPGVRSSDCVTGSLAPITPTSPNSSFSSSPPKKIESPTNNSSTAASIPCYCCAKTIFLNDPSRLTMSDASGASGIITEHSRDALDLLLNIFPRNGLSILPFAKSVVVSAPNMGASFDGVVLELPGKPKTLYVDGKNAPAVSLRESIVALLDLADEQLQCSALVIVLDKLFNGLNELLHSLMYVGGNIVAKPPFQVNPAYILVGLEI
ncbi:ornithine decarboxylase antizyme-domain-containing protein [Melanogaster broomeanus]|nr:ornithine decarboxylase antizyme-domain-containing protein [Melanogaster broomeanus]